MTCPGRSGRMAVVMMGFLAGGAVAAQTVDPADPVARPSRSTDSLGIRISEVVSAYSGLDMFSGVVLVAKDGEVIYQGAFGDANKDHDVPNRPTTRFNIGSIGKTFTAVSIMQLVEAGALQLSDPLSKFFPDLPFPEKHQITVRHLLSHSSGLGDYLDHPDYRRLAPTIRGLGDALPLVYDEQPAAAPGAEFSYSNSGFLLLGGIIERISGLSYSEYLQERIFGPLQMSHSGIVYDEEVLPDRSIGYTKNWDGTYRANVRVAPAPCSAGGLRTTAEDLLRFDQALLGTTLLSESSKALLFEPSGPRPSYGLGWEIKEYAGHRLLGHSGGTDGVEAFFYRFVDDGYTLITLANYDGGNGQVASDIEAILFGQDYALPTQIDANFTLGYALQAAGDHEGAVKVFARNLGADPPHLPSLFFSASSRNTANLGLDEALAELDRFIGLADDQSFPPKIMAWSRKAAVLEKLGRIPDAILSYQELLKLDPDNARARERLARLQGG